MNLKKNLGRLQQKALVAVGARKMDDSEFAVYTGHIDELQKFYSTFKEHLGRLEKTFFATAEPLMSVSAVIHDFYSTSKIDNLIERGGNFKSAAQSVTKSHIDYCNHIKDLLVECDQTLEEIGEIKKECTHRGKIMLDNDKAKHAMTQLMEKPPKNPDQSYQDKLAAAKEAYKATNDRFLAINLKCINEINVLWESRFSRVSELHEKLASAQFEMYAASSRSSQALKMIPIKRDESVADEESVKKSVDAAAASKKATPVPKPKRAVAAATAAAAPATAPPATAAKPSSPVLSRESGIRPTVNRDSLNALDAGRELARIGRRNVAAVAKFDSKHRTPKELPFAKGDSITILEVTDQDWWKAQKGTRKGWVPRAFMLLDGESDDSDKADGDKTDSDATNTAKDKGADDDNDSAGTSQVVAKASDDSGDKPAPIELPRFAKVQHSYEKCESGEISIKEGEWVRVISTRTQEEADDEDEDEDEDEAEGWWTGVVLGGDGTAGQFPGNYVSLLSKTDVALATAEYDYEARESSELSFSEGDKIVILEREEGNAWWIGTLFGARDTMAGEFPHNFVKLDGEAADSEEQKEEEDEEEEKEEEEDKVEEEEEDEAEEEKQEEAEEEEEAAAAAAKEKEEPEEKEAAEEKEEPEEKEDENDATEDSTAAAAEPETVSERKDGATDDDEEPIETTELPSESDAPPAYDESAPPRPAKANKPVVAPATITCVAVYDYDAKEDNELSFKVGDRLLDIENEEDPDGWWTGTLNGKRGLFPHNFAKIVNTPPPDALGQTSSSRRKFAGAVAMPGMEGGLKFDPSAALGSLKKTTK